MDDSLFKENSTTNMLTGKPQMFKGYFIDTLVVYLF